MAEIEAGPEVNALVSERVMGIDPRATSPAEIGRAVMQGMVSNFPRDGYDVMCFNWGTPSTVELTYSGSKFNYGEADGNDGYGLYFWEHRAGAAVAALHRGVCSQVAQATTAVQHGHCRGLARGREDEG